MAWRDNNTTGCENISSLWMDFTQNTGFHGVNKLTVGRNYKFRCFLWTFAVVSMLTYMSYTITKEILNYYRYPTVTNMKVEVVEEITFPAVTICNQSPYNMTKVTEADPELKSFFENDSILASFQRPIDWDTQYLRPTFREPKDLEWWKSLLMDPRKMFLQCFMLGKLYEQCSEIMKPVMTKYGICGTFNFNVSEPTRVRLTGSDNNFILLGAISQGDYVPGSYLSAGFRVILHESHVHPDTATSSFLTGPGTTTYAALRMSTLKYLPRPFKAFANSTCIDTTAPDFNNTLEFFDAYTYGHCILECQQRKILDMCSCARFQNVDWLGRECSMFELKTCYEPTLVELEQDAYFKKTYDCEIPCSFQLYDAKISTSKYPSNVFVDLILNLGGASDESVMRDNLVEIRIYFEELLVQSVEQVAQYNTQTLIGNLGGQMGICLGASILTITELGEFLIIMVLMLVRKVTHKGQIRHTGNN